MNKINFKDGKSIVADINFSLVEADENNLDFKFKESGVDTFTHDFVKFTEKSMNINVKNEYSKLKSILLASVKNFKLHEPVNR